MFQVIIQSTLLFNECWRLYKIEVDEGPQLAVDYYAYFQFVSVGISLISVSWSIFLHGRSLRFLSNNTANAIKFQNYFSKALQLIWRLCTVLSRPRSAAVNEKKKIEKAHKESNVVPEKDKTAKMK
uniref:XK-related protein n=1 Tax=Ditylenchus dipsaci TaxID=166011 RepID=A0A915E489_9BILA